MKIQVKKNMKCGEVPIPAGEYLARLSSDTSQIFLVGKGLTIKLPATKRRQQSRARSEQVQYFCAGAKVWSLVISSPKHGEWATMLDEDKQQEV